MMVKSIKIELQVDAKPFYDFAKSIKNMGEKLSLISAPICSINTTAFAIAVDHDYEQKVIEAIETFNAAQSFAEIRWYRFEPANMPIELRLQYQYQFWMTPLWFIQDTFTRAKDGFTNRMPENDMNISKIANVFYRVKLFICMTLDLQPDEYPEYGDYVQVIYTDGGAYYPPSEPTIHWYSSLVVGYGVFRGWYYFEHSDSD